MSDGLPADVKVGDELVLRTGNRYRGDETVTVSRIGRKYLYVSRAGREMRERFHRTGREDTGYNPAYLLTPSQYEESTRRAAVTQSLREIGIEIRHEFRADFTVEKMQRMLDALDDEEKDGQG